MPLTERLGGGERLRMGGKRLRRGGQRLEAASAADADKQHAKSKKHARRMASIYTKRFAVEPKDSVCLRPTVLYRVYFYCLHGGGCRNGRRKLHFCGHQIIEPTTPLRVHVLNLGLEPT